MQVSLQRHAFFEDGVKKTFLNRLHLKFIRFYCRLVDFTFVFKGLNRLFAFQSLPVLGTKEMVLIFMFLHAVYFQTS